MANWDLVLAYDERATEWFKEKGYPCPSVKRGNRTPTTGDVYWAIGQRGPLPTDYPLLVEGFDWDDDDSAPDEGFRIRGDELVELKFLIKLCERCGQLLVWGEGGWPVMVMDAAMTAAEIVLRVLRESERVEDWLGYFFQQMYGAIKDHVDATSG